MFASARGGVVQASDRNLKIKGQPYNVNLTLVIYSMGNIILTGLFVNYSIRSIINYSIRMIVFGIVII
jgi:hypothetical protein